MYENIMIKLEGKLTFRGISENNVDQASAT